MVAAEEPEIAANMEQPITVVWNSRPGRKLIHGAMPEKSDCDRRVRNNNSPIRMNSGRETMSEDVRTLNAQLAINLCVGRLVNNSSRTTAVAIKAGPIQIPAHKVTVIRTRSQVRIALMRSLDVLADAQAGVVARFSAQQPAQPGDDLQGEEK